MWILPECRPDQACCCRESHHRHPIRMYIKSQIFQSFPPLLLPTSSHPLRGDGHSSRVLVPSVIPLLATVLTYFLYISSDSTLCVPPDHLQTRLHWRWAAGTTGVAPGLGLATGTSSLSDNHSQLVPATSLSLLFQVSLPNNSVMTAGLRPGFCPTPSPHTPPLPGTMGIWHGRNANPDCSSEQSA